MKKNVLNAFFILIILFCASRSFAHPLGMRSFGFRSHLDIYKDHLEFHFIAEIPTTVLMSEIMEFKQKRNIEEFDDRAANLFDHYMVEKIAGDLRLFLDGKRHGWRRAHDYKYEAGKGDLNFFEYRINLVAILPDIQEGAEYQLEIENIIFPEYPSVFMNGIVSHLGVELVSTNLPKEMNWSEDYSYRNIKAKFVLDSDIETKQYRGNLSTITNEDNDSTFLSGSRLLSFIKKKNLTTTFIAVP